MVISRVRQVLILKNRKVYFGLLGFFMLTYVIRIANIKHPAIVTQHISNFSLTGVLTLIVLYERLTKKGFTKKKLLISLAPFAVLNIVMELFVRVKDIHFGLFSFIDFNTPDPLDMVFGLLSLILIYFMIIQFAAPINSKTK